MVLTATWTKVEIYSQPDGTAVAHWATNDDNDDGFPDGEVVRATYTYKSLAKAKEIWGKSRLGYYGQPVDVYIDDKKV